MVGKLMAQDSKLPSFGGDDHAPVMAPAVSERDGAGAARFVADVRMRGHGQGRNKRSAFAPHRDKARPIAASDRHLANPKFRNVWLR